MPENLVKDMGVLELCKHIRISEQNNSVLELVRRVEKLMGHTVDCIPGSAADWLRNTLDPVPQSVLDALSAISDKQEPSDG